MVSVATSYSIPIIFCVNQMLSSAYNASTPPVPLAATKVRYSAAEERTMDISFFETVFGFEIGVVEISVVQFSPADSAVSGLYGSVSEH